MRTIAEEMRDPLSLAEEEAAARFHDHVGLVRNIGLLIHQMRRAGSSGNSKMPGTKSPGWNWKTKTRFA